ncbi:MAG: deoxyhypusine synthase [Candidatus Sericytochromatia bacterium]|nr:deoxyhypusine synthase [Candidatus Sericytochromatia bacterium]
MKPKAEFLAQTVKHIDITRLDVVDLVDAMAQTAFQARNLGRAAKIYETMLRDPNCSVILCLAGSLVSAGLRKVINDLVANNMVDAIVSTGANIVDQDFFEGLGFNHYVGDIRADDAELRALAIDRIYDTYIDEEQLRHCDDVLGKIADSLPHKPHSSREFIREMGRYLVDNNLGEGAIVRTAFERHVPIFVPAFSDCSAGFGLVYHQWHNPESHVSLDSAKDFLELTKLKLASGETGLLMVGGGVPKNFAQDIVVAAEVLGQEVPMHKYAIQITVADERDGGLSGSTLREASSWGKVDLEQEQMVFAEATLAFPLVAGYAYGKKAYEGRAAREFTRELDKRPATV